MKLLTATNRQTGERWFYTTRIIFRRKQFSADVSADCVGPSAIKQTWHNSLREARETAQARGTFTVAP